MLSYDTHPRDAGAECDLDRCGCSFCLSRSRDFVLNGRYGVLRILGATDSAPDEARESGQEYWSSGIEAEGLAVFSEPQDPQVESPSKLLSRIAGMVSPNGSTFPLAHRGDNS